MLFIARSYLYSSYRVCSWFLFRKIGKHRRRRLPDCLGIISLLVKNNVMNSVLFSVQFIRDTHPEANGVYRGYREGGDMSEED